MIKKIDVGRGAYVLSTEHTTYAFSVTDSGHLEHLYYGRRIGIDDEAAIQALREKHEFEPGNAINYSKDTGKFQLEDLPLEYAAGGHGDIREPMLELVFDSGARTTDFLFESAEITKGKAPFDELPGSHGAESEVEQLLVTLKDGKLKLELSYWVFAGCDVITRSAKLTNTGERPIEVERLMSLLLDLPYRGWCVTSFHGGWAREMNASTYPVLAGKHVIESRTGTSSSRANPFFMFHPASTTEDAGDCYGFNLIYSGNHYEAIEASPYGKTRIVSGINPEGFRFVLGHGESLQAPEAVMTYSKDGFSGQSRNMHRFVRAHILTGAWRDKLRPVLVNSWEACYLNINERNLVALAKEAKDLGIELFVMDDGWFGERNTDDRSLGDWDVNPKKLPGGLSRLGSKINSMGLMFGIWVEPEMVNVNSRLYEQHPDWAMQIEGRLHSEGRNQRILDLSNPEVVDYLIEKLSEVFSSAHIDYVKWDMNRIFTDVFSPYLPAKRMGEVAHRYVLGLYRMMRTLTGRFPHILFEGCASGGNRFDLGILCYFPQIWGSDNTDAVCRTQIQQGYSYGYPLSCVGSHVASSPGHQTMRRIPLQTRFNVAAFGALGYEMDLRDLTRRQKEEIKNQIALYKLWRDVFQQGDFYRVQDGRIHSWTVVSADKKRAVGMMVQALSEPNTGVHWFVAKGLDSDTKYRFYNIDGRVDIKSFGSLINTMAPFHVKPDSLIHSQIARAMNIRDEKENVTVSGDVLMHAGVALAQSFSGTGFKEGMRVFPDFASRMYFMEAVEDSPKGA